MTEQNLSEEKVGIGTMMSYGTGKFVAEFLTGAQGLMAFYFFEKEMKLNSWLAMLALVIYSVWNAINDPLIGFLTNKWSPNSRKLGRRFPWIITGLVLCSLSFALIFSVPASWAGSNQLGLFFWLVGFLCLYDMLYSLWELNYQAIFPDKFRSNAVRTRTIEVATPIGVVGMTLGFVLPPMFYDYGVKQSYLLASLVVAGIAIICTILIIPGVKETPEMIARFAKKQEDEKAHPEESVPFIKALKASFKNRNLLALLLCLFLYQSRCMCMTGSVNYVVEGVLGLGSGQTVPIMAGMIVGSLLGVLLWSQIQKRLRNNQKLLVLSAVAMGCVAIPMTFLRSSTAFMIAMALWGLGFGGFWTFMTPAMADVVDETVLRDKKRNDGIILGLRAFFMRFSYASQALVFALCHRLTGYNSASGAVQTELAKWGITLHMGAIPGIFFLLAALMFWRLNTLNPEKTAANSIELKKLDI
ncbi:MAG: MFS transporter [Sphaerochaetaceae bacterium]|nr:MFS transporter [Sphaerochaetaceae bacterium]